MYLFSSDSSTIEKGSAEAFSLYPLTENASIYNPSAITYHKRMSIIPLRLEVANHGDFFGFLIDVSSKLTPTKEDYETKNDKMFYLKSTAGVLKDHFGFFVAMNIKSNLFPNKDSSESKVHRASNLSFKTSLTYGFLLFDNLRLGASLHGIYSLKKSIGVPSDVLSEDRLYGSYMSLTKGAMSYVDLALDVGALWPLQLSQNNFFIPSLSLNGLALNLYEDDTDSYDKALILSKQTQLSLGSGFKSNLPSLKSTLTVFYNYQLGFVANEDISSLHKIGLNLRALQMFYMYTGLEQLNFEEPSFSLGYFNRYFSVGLSRFYQEVSYGISKGKSNPLWGYFLRFSYQF